MESGVMIGVPKEIAAEEKRVALTPETTQKLVKTGARVAVETGAGENSYFPDSLYQTAGAEVLPDSISVYKKSDVVVKVGKPLNTEVEQLREGTVLVAFLAPFVETELIKTLARRNITSFSMDAVPRITRAQKLDALSAMSTVAGYKAVLMAADASPKFFPMLMTAAGTIPPARVFVIGAGVAGLQAIATARRLGAVVEAFDTRPAVKEQVESLGAKFALLDLHVDATEAQDKSGYAKELSKEFYQKEEALIHEKVRSSDIVITTALIPGKPAPRLITEAMVQDMRPGSVIVDLAAEMGGNCALTEPGKEIERHGVKIFCTLNLPSLVPFHASQMYSRNILAFLDLILKDKSLVFDFSDEIIAGMCITHQGEIVHREVRKVISPAPLKGPA